MHSIVMKLLVGDMDQCSIYLNKILNTVHYLALESFLVGAIQSALQISLVRIEGDSTDETLAPMAQKNCKLIRIRMALFRVLSFSGPIL